MASGGSLSSALRRISSSHLQCSICQERYKQPKTLHCEHSFCQDCLQKYHKSRFIGASQIPCPMCQRETVLPQTGIQGLKANFPLTGMLEDVALQEKVACSDIKKLPCEACDKGNEAKYCCLDCEQNICFKCEQKHRKLKFRAVSSHTIATFEDIRQGKVTIGGQMKCDKHMKQAMQFYCVTCKVLICQACTAVDHSRPEHHFMDYREASEKFKQLLNSQFSDFSKDVEELKATLNETFKAKIELKDKTAVVHKAVQAKAAEVISKVKAEEKQLLDEIDIIGHVVITRLNKHEKKLVSLLQRKQHTLDTAKDAATKTSDSNFLCLYPLIQKDFEMLNTQHPTKISCMLQYPILTGDSVCDINLGKLVVENTWELFREFGKKGSGPGEFEIARGIAASQSDELAVADWENKRVVFYTNQGQITGSIQPVTSGYIAPIPNQWVVANLENVKVYSRDKKLAFKFVTVPESESGKTNTCIVSVAVKENGNIIVGDRARKVLTEHNPTDGSLIRTMPVEITPDYLAVINNDRIAVSSEDQRQVDVVDDTATSIFTIKPTIAGQPVEHCTGVCSNSTGIYAVAWSTESCHIHHYDSNGTFLSCVIQGLYSPLGITFTADGQQLAVADRHSVKIYHKV